MSELDNAIDRLGEAVANMMAASEQDGAETATTEQIVELTAERDQLLGEVEELRGLREGDALLRSDAADAVKVALTDLRSLVAVHEQAG